MHTACIFLMMGQTFMNRIISKIFIPLVVSGVFLNQKTLRQGYSTLKNSRTAGRTCVKYN